MADGHLVPNDQGVGIMRHVQHAEILHVGPVPDTDMIDVAPDHGIEPDAALFPHHYIADDNSGVFYKAGVWNGRLYALECSDHGTHCR